MSADDLGNVYISGYTGDSLGGQTSAGGLDPFVSKYNAAGTLQWTRQLGTSSDDLSLSVSADGLGNVYISGGSTGSLAGPNTGGYDAFVAKISGANAPEPSTFILGAAGLTSCIAARRRYLPSNVITHNGKTTNFNRSLSPFNPAIKQAARESCRQI